MKRYEVISYDEGCSHGVYDTLDEAKGCVAYDRLRHYQIWTYVGGKRVSLVRESQNQEQAQ